jgi:hypothetical protein
MMPPGFQEFIDEVRADSRMPAALVDQAEEIIRETVAECGEHVDAIEFLDALGWIFKQRDRPIVKRLDAVRKLTGLPRGKVIVNMRELTGW